MVDFFVEYCDFVSSFTVTTMEGEGENFMQFANEVLTVLEAEDKEKLQLERLKNIWSEIQELQTMQQNQLKRQIQELIEIEQSETEKEVNSVEIDKVKQEKDKMHAMISSSKAHLSKVKGQCEEVKQRVQKNEQEKDRLAEEREKLRKEMKHSLPTAKYDVNLYSNITGIRWQFDCEPEEIKGYVCNKKDVKPFSLNSKQVSKFFIANYLWDIIEEDW